MALRILYQWECGHADFCHEWHPPKPTVQCDKCGKPLRSAYVVVG